MEAKHTQQGDRHEVVITCDTNELMTLLGLVGEGASCHPARVLGPKATAQDYEIYNATLPIVVRVFGRMVNNINQAAAAEAVRREHTA